MHLFKSKINPQDYTIENPANTSIRIFPSRGLLYLASIIQVELMGNKQCSECEKCTICKNMCKNNRCNCSGSCIDKPCNTHRNNLYETVDCTKEMKFQYTSKFNQIINAAKNKTPSCNYTITLGNKSVIPLKGVLAKLIKKGEERYCGLCTANDILHFFYAKRNGCNFEIKNMLNLEEYKNKNKQLIRNYDITYIVNNRKLSKTNIIVNANNETIKMHCNPDPNQFVLCNKKNNTNLELTGIKLEKDKKAYEFTKVT